MSNAPLILRPLMRFADFKGRARRAEFWPFILFVWLVFFGGYGFALYPAFAGGGFKIDAAIPGMMAILPALMLLSLVVFLPVLAVQVRRLHDSNRTGWWLVLPSVASMIGQSLVYALKADEIANLTLSVGTQMAAVEPMGAFNMARIIEIEWPLLALTLPYTMGASLMGYLVLVGLYLWPGSPGDNRFGPNPRS